MWSHLVKDWYFNVITHQAFEQLPAPGGPKPSGTNQLVANPQQLLASGGILADDMGLGKTLQTISLIVTGGDGGNGKTLIVCPLGVMSTWAEQIAQHVRPEHRLRVLIYHGSRTTHRSQSAFAAEIEDYDVVVTTYGKLRPDNEVFQRTLAAVEWRRVILDEGHNIRNSGTNAARGACALKAKSRWVLSGTPMYVLTPKIQ